MPKILLINGFSFFFFSNEGFEPPHIHVKKGDAEAKIWLTPYVRLDYSEDFSTREIRFILETATKNRETFIQKWHEYFGY